jgi:glycosyltransferase involved in cell wall biosynthesis
MIKLLIISHAFVEKRAWKRWILLSQFYPDVDITLLAPISWKEGDSNNYTFGKVIIKKGKEWEQDRFKVRLIDMQKSRFFDWISYGLINEIRINQPNIVYHIGHDLQEPLIETILATKLFAPKAKIVAFSMRGLPHNFNLNNQNWKKNIQCIYNRVKWQIVKMNCHALFCHYPEARRLFLKEGFRSVYIQTQIGVDAYEYNRNEIARNKIRKKYDIDDAFVFGSATRFNSDKGLFEILKALPKEGKWRYLMLGSGTQQETLALRSEILNLNFEDKVIMPGFINWIDMPTYMSAFDCALHVPRTTTYWIETFSLALTQEMSMSLPVIGNTSGSIPYQLGENGIVVPEGDISSLRDQMIRIMNNPNEARRIGALMRKRVLDCFDITHLVHCFHSAMLDIINDVFYPEKLDMAEFPPIDLDDNAKQN